GRAGEARAGEPGKEHRPSGQEDEGRRRHEEREERGWREEREERRWREECRERRWREECDEPPWYCCPPRFTPFGGICDIVEDSLRLSAGLLPCLDLCRSPHRE